MTYIQHIQTPIGILYCTASETHITGIHYNNAPMLADKHHANSALLQEAETQLQAYFAGTLRAFNLPLYLAQGTPFQQQCWQALAAIPYGETWSYKQQAEYLGKPKAVRAVGSANGKNPFSIILPCHRVIGSNKSLGGYAGGLDKKQFLLQHEQAVTSL